MMHMSKSHVSFLILKTRNNCPFWLSAQYLKNKGFALDEIILAGIANEYGGVINDRLKGRVIFPIENMDGQVVAYSGRILDNSKEEKFLFLN